MKKIEMNPKQWNDLRINDPEEFKRAYCEFMFDAANICWCDICPQNIGQNGGAYPWSIDGPCGLTRCLVKAYVELPASANPLYVEEDDDEYDFNSVEEDDEEYDFDSPF